MNDQAFRGSALACDMCGRLLKDGEVIRIQKTAVVSVDNNDVLPDDTTFERVCEACVGGFVCCGSRMLHETNPGLGFGWDEEYVCLECGRYWQHGMLDEEELEAWQKPAGAQ